LKARVEHAHKVRFNDGTEAMLRRNELSILKEFKGILGNDEAPTLPPSPRGRGLG
jgi:hypothetical protein